MHNTALLTAQQDAAFAETRKRPEVWGRWVEAAIGAHLLNKQWRDGYTVHYWRHRNDEVDFVLQKNGKTLAPEVKSGARQRIAGMESFKKLYRPNKIMLVGNSGMPWQEFLKLEPGSCSHRTGSSTFFIRNSYAAKSGHTRFRFLLLYRSELFGIGARIDDFVQK